VYLGNKELLSMQKGKKITAVMMLPTLLCLFSFLLSACGGSSTATVNTTKAPESQQILTDSFLTPDIASFDPAIATDEYSIQAVDMVFTGLVTFNNNLQVEPALAQSWTVSKNGLTYTFHLRPNLKFSDGTPLTSADVAYSIDRALSPALNNQNGTALTYLGLIKNATQRTEGKVSTIIGTGIMTPNSSTVVINLTKATGYFLQALTYPVSYVIEKSVYQKWGSNWVNHLSDNGGQGGDGPFKVLSYSHTTGIKFVPNKNYWGTVPQLKELDYVPYKDVQTGYNAYLANQVDIATVPSTMYNTAKKQQGFVDTPALTTFQINLNAKVNPLQNIQIRQAFELALNRDTINTADYSGAVIPSCHIVPQGQYGYDPNLKCPDNTTPAGNATEAVKLFDQGLKAEGLTAKTFPKLTYTYPSNNPTAANEAATEIQMWKTVLGITVLPNAIEQTTLWTEQTQTTGKAGPLQIWMSGWGADFPDPEDWITLQFGKGSPDNYSNFGNNSGSANAQEQQLQAKMAAADVMPMNTKAEQNARASAYNAIEQQLVNDVAWITIYQRPELTMVKPYVIGLKFNAETEIPPQSWGSVYIATH
jgi:oligopeptide transport system substrate-binding protein